MSAFRIFRPAARAVTAATTLATATYAALVARAWHGFAHPAPPQPYERDELLDRFMPAYDVVERHCILIAAPPATVLAAAKDQDLMQSPVTRAIFKTRALAVGAPPDNRPQPRGLLAATLAWGWGMLAESRDREIVMGAVTQPWAANVIFRSLPPDRFAIYDEPGYVKIVWTLRAKPLGEYGTLFMTETRASATDTVARRKFRRYWAFASPGIAVIRWLLLRPLKKEAERRWREATGSAGTSGPARPLTPALE